MQHQESLQSYQHMYTDFAMNTPKAAAYLNRFNVEKSPETEEGNGRRVRTAFTEPQLQELEREFVENGAFLLPIRRTQIASRLGLREKQIKIWFQNRRMKAKKATGILPNGNKIVKPKPPKKRLPVIKPLVAEIIGNPAIKRKRDFNPQVLVQVPANQTLPRLPETVQIEQEQIQQIRWVVVDTPYLAQQQKQPPILMPAQPPILIPAQPPISMPAQPQQLLSQTEAECEVQTLLNESSFAEYLTPHPSGFQQGNVPASAPQIQQAQQQFHIQQGHIQQEPYFQVTNQQEIVQHQTEHHQPASSMFSEGEFNVGEFIDSFDKFVDETKDQEFTLNETQIAENFNLDLADLEIDDLLNLSRSDIMDLSFLSEPEPPTPTITISFEDLMNPTMKISS